ncbi:dihydroorotate dehydrogenase (quinone), mitochondrial-like [Sabethes cyaneus]|uniref:dihydroorotate dehydrogenase (quinone), mitochondrial-like n=1 Tax=Sabethes cyaneus TaxID=53552 RepID=UPI00237E7F8A|nr:dihydroorotate dehydrogenase (quinone), mitochondrial-like [Sabethes cyaneus]
MDSIRMLLKVTTLGAINSDFARLERGKADGRMNQFGVAVNCGFIDEKEARSAQTKSNLHLLASESLKVRSSLPMLYRTPIMVKLTPDLSDRDVQEIIEIVNHEECPVDGLIVTGTTVERWTNLKSFNTNRSGGWLGQHFLEKSVQFAAKVCKWTDCKIPTGGLIRGREAYNQLFTGSDTV